MTWRSVVFVFCTVLNVSILVFAQSAGNYVQDEHIFNEGGNPLQGQVLASTNFIITLDAVGQSLGLTELSGSSFQMQAGFVPAYPPPLETLNLKFVTKTQMIWDHEKSVGTYNIYRGNGDNFAPFGACMSKSLPSENGQDSEIPAPNQFFYYLVTAENQIEEEGTKGYESDGTERINAAPCPQ